MIDNPELMQRLLTKLQAALPISARVMPEVAAALQAENPISEIPRLDFARESEKEVFASITHLRFDPGLPLAREIAAYQKRRVKRLHRQHL
jgi:hypothetical protein